MGREIPAIHQQNEIMMNKYFFNRVQLLSVSVLLGLFTAGCDSQIYDYLEPCHSNYHLKFRYDYNMKYADAFPSEVNSVAVWAFDESGRLAWKHKESGEVLAAAGYRVDVPLPPGTYDFVTWCGLSSDSPFVVDSEDPVAISELGMTLSLSEISRAGENTKVSDQSLSGLYHDIKKGVEISDNPDEESDNEIGFSLINDTNYFKILLQNLDGAEMKKGDFSFRITGGNNRLEHDNAPGQGEDFHYIPWSVTSAETTLMEDESTEGTITSVSSVLAELHTTRLMADGSYRLVVHRNTDGKDIINIPLVDYLLLVKGNYRKMSDQEYLDRQDEHTMIFFIDKDSNWYRAIGIYVNAWHVVPPQDATLQ